MYGWRMTNFVESTNDAAIPSRFKFPFQFFRHFIEQFMTNAYKSKSDVDKMLKAGRVLTPEASEMIQTQKGTAGFYTILPFSGTTFFVQDTRGLTARYRIYVAERTCICSYIRQYVLPCFHHVAALVKLKHLDTCDTCYHVLSYWHLPTSRESSLSSTRNYNARASYRRCRRSPPLDAKKKAICTPSQGKT
jgi:hypothetical protein